MTLIIDSDAHVVETPDIFTSRFPTKYANLVPNVKFDPKTGADMWFVGDTPVHSAVFSAICGKKDDPIVRRAIDPQAGLFPKTIAEVHPSTYDPNERVKVMDSFGIRSATTYPNLRVLGPEVYRSMPDADLDFQMQVVAAYNDWILTWGQQQPGRFIPLACIPYWDVKGAVREIERCAEMGMKGLVMSGRPQIHGCPILPDPQWDPIWAAAQAAGLSISFHAGAGGFENHMTDERRRIQGNEAAQTFATVALLFENTFSATDLLMSGILQRFPRLNFAIVETGIGWVPYTLEALDRHYIGYQSSLTRAERKQRELPSDLFRRQVFVNVWFERLTDHMRELGLIDNVMFETDYPHLSCLLADDISKAIENGLAILTQEEKDNVLFKNAMRCFNLTPMDVGL